MGLDLSVKEDLSCSKIDFVIRLSKRDDRLTMGTFIHLRNPAALEHAFFSIENTIEEPNSH